MIYTFLNCYLAVPRPTLGHSWGDSLSNLMVITAFFYYFDPKVIRSLVMRFGSLSPAEHLVGFEPVTFQFEFQCFNPLGHSPVNVDSFLQKENWTISHKFAFYSCFEIWKWVGKNFRKIINFFFAAAQVKHFFITCISGNKTIYFFCLIVT